MTEHAAIEEKFYAALGLSMRAGKCITGEEQVLKLVRNGKAKLVIIAADASDNTAKKFRDKCSFYNIPFVIAGTREKIGHSIGKDVRVVIAITESGLAALIRKHSENLVR